MGHPSTGRIISPWTLFLAALLVRTALGAKGWPSGGSRRFLQKEGPAEANESSPGEKTCEAGFILREIDLVCELCDVRCISGNCENFSGCSLCQEGFFTSRRDNLYPFKCRLCDVPNCKECEQGIIDGLPPICIQCQQGFYSIDGGLQCINDPSAIDVLEETRTPAEIAAAPQESMSVTISEEQCGDRERLGADGKCYKCNRRCQERLESAAFNASTKQITKANGVSTNVVSNTKDGSETNPGGVDRVFGTTTYTVTNTTTRIRSGSAESSGSGPISQGSSGSVSTSESSTTRRTQRSESGSSSRPSETQENQESTSPSSSKSNNVEQNQESASGPSMSPGQDPTTQGSSFRFASTSGGSQTSQSLTAGFSQSSGQDQTTQSTSFGSTPSSDETQTSRGSNFESSLSSSAAHSTAEQISGATRTSRESNSDLRSTSGAARTSQGTTSDSSYSESRVSTHETTRVSRDSTTTVIKGDQGVHTIKQIWQSCPIHESVAACEVDKICSACDSACAPGHCFSFVGCIRCAHGYSVVRTQGSITLGCAPCKISNCHHCMDGGIDDSPQVCAECDIGFDFVPTRGDCQLSGAVQSGYALPPSDSDGIESSWEDELDIEWDSWGESP